MSRMQAPAKPSAMSRALARDRLGVPAVLFFVLAGVAPLTVAAGVIPSAYATTGLTAIPSAFLVIALILVLFAAGYVAMTRHITNAGAFYAFIARGLGRLEASSPDSRRLYLRHGYADYGQCIELPGGPALYPMWRQPRDPYHLGDHS